MHGLLILCLLCSLLLLFVFTHLRPLARHEVEALAHRKRRRAIKRYFSFANAEVQVSKDFKSRMNPDGTFYQLDEDLSLFPSVAAGLLKYKKHEWIMIGFEKSRRVSLLWLNKGLDRSAVSSCLPTAEVVHTAKSGGYKSVLVFHNHPNTNPSRYDCTRASKPDVTSATDSGTALIQCGVNLLEFVCERGRHYQYYREYSTAFLPAAGFVDELNRANGKSRAGNLRLHLERVF